MAKSDAVIDEAKDSADEKPVVVSSKRRPSKGVKIGAAVVGAAALFAGGVFASQYFFSSQDDTVDGAKDSFATQQLVASLKQGDALLKEAQAAKAPEELQAKGVQLQTLAVAMEPLAQQFSDKDMQQAAEQLAQGYLDISIGLVTNSGPKTDEGAKALNEGRQKLVDVLGVDQQNQDQQNDQQQPPAEGQPESGN